jgi:recombinational DNA repair ATPase RecF
MYDYNLAIVTSKDEEDDFKFLDMLCNRIKTMYTIKSVKFEKFKKGKSSKIKGDPEKVLELCDNLMNEIISKLNTLHITLPTNMLMRINKKTIKKFPKELRYIYEQYMED